MEAVKSGSVSAPAFAQFAGMWAKKRQQQLTLPRKVRPESASEKEKRHFSFYFPNGPGKKRRQWPPARLTVDRQNQNRRVCVCVWRGRPFQR